MYLLPQEIESKYVIPAIRRDLSKNLVLEYKISYDKIGKLLGITKAAVSQYLSDKRASKVKLHPKIEIEIKKSCEKIVKGKGNSLGEISRILKVIRKKKLHCEICGRKSGNEFHDCKQIVVKYEDCD